MTAQKPFRVEVVDELGRELTVAASYGLDEGAFDALRQRWESWAGLARDVAA